MKEVAGKVLLVTSDCIGERGELGKILMRGFLHTLEKSTVPPGKMIFLNHGVRLTTEDEEIVEVLASLAGRGVEVLSCGTCLDYFGLKESLRVGRITNMHDTVDALVAVADPVTTVC